MGTLRSDAQGLSTQACQRCLRRGLKAGLRPSWRGLRFVLINHHPADTEDCGQQALSRDARPRLPQAPHVTEGWGHHPSSEEQCGGRLASCRAPRPPPPLPTSRAGRRCRAAEPRVWALLLIFSHPIAPEKADLLPAQP